MDKDKIFKYFFVFLLGVTLYLAFLILRPYFSYIVLGVILTYAFTPVYVYIKKHVKNESMSAVIVIAIFILIIVIPCFFIVTTLIRQTGEAINLVSNSNVIENVETAAKQSFGLTVDVHQMIQSGIDQLKSSLISFSITLFQTISDMLIGFFITFFIMYYGFKSGDELIGEIKTLIPLHDRYKNKFFEETKNLTHAVIYGQVVVSIIQGAVGGIGFWIFGVPNPVFWGVIMVIFAFLPFVGTPMIWVPAVILEFMNHHYGLGIGLLIYSGIITTNIDNFLRPGIISSKTRLHPVLVLLGVFGGLSVFGFIGIMIGPIILAILVIFLQEYTIDFKSTLVQKENRDEDPKLAAAVEKELLREDQDEGALKKGEAKKDHVLV